MRKIPLLFLSILATGLFFGTSQPSHAMVLEGDTAWWTVEELLDFYPEAEAEKEAECGDNLDCRMEYSFTMGERSEKHSALRNLLESQFWVTSINPETETIKVLFFDDEMMLKRMGIEEKLELENLYIGWTESWVGHGYYHNFEAPFDDTMLGIHQLYNSEIQDIGAITPWQEDEFQMLDPRNISNNTNGMLYFSIYAKDNMFNAQGDINYSNCLNAPDYQEGMECKLYFSGSRWASFFPPRDQIIEQGPITILTEPILPETSITAEEPISSTDANVLSGRPTDQNESNKPTRFVELASIEISAPDNPKGVDLKTPETGQGKIEPNNATEMPWWIVLLGIIGAMLIVWWSIPTKAQKIRRKYKKTIDKKRILR